MARLMALDDRLFRAVVVRTYADSRTATYVYGPFTAKAPATSVVNAEVAKHRYQERAGWGWQGAYELSTRIERCEPTWEES